MQIFQRASLKRKQMLVILFTTGVALSLACAAFVASEILTFRTQMLRDLATLAELVGNSAAAGLAFDDAKAAEEALAALRAEPHIAGACVFSKTGVVFAKYDRAFNGRTFVPPPFQPEGHVVVRGEVTVFEPVSFKGETIGVVSLTSDLRALSHRLAQYAAIVTGVFMGTFLVAYLLSARLQRLISEPILELVRVTGAVARSRDYSVRAVRRSDDEIGLLIDSFNEMLAQIQERDAILRRSIAQIQERDAILRRANDELESRVKARTQELAGSLSLVNAALESTPDGILVVDARGLAMNFNQRFVKLWDMPPGLIAARDRQAMLDHAVPQLSDPDAFLRVIGETGKNPEAESFDVLELRDGRTIERQSRPMHVGAEPVGRVWCFRDITERKRAEAELRALHTRLLETSRQAGMAEVASGVLHNVGNVLNSVNVSASLAGDRLRKSRMPNVARVAALMAEHAADLGGFMTQDPKGRQLPGYLAQLAEHLTQEQALLVREIDLLKKNIDHIKEIVAVQQSYAKVSGVTETLNVVDLIEDAVRMNAGALARHEVRLTREYAPDLPPVTVEKHKVLQILVNLIRNAKYACDESGSTDKHLRLQVRADHDRIRIAVADNGVGIPPENLLRIFNHGFTTRATGHGFGLHSGALAARELGGSLVGESAGTGRGATFTLEFPRAPVRPKS